MNSAIASILLSKIEDLVWLDNKFGLTRPAVIAVSNPLDGTKTLKKTFPVACNLSEDECSAGAYMDCVPTSKFTSLLYFEDNGVQILGADDRWIQFRSNLKLVCWLNGKKLGHDGCSLSTKALSD